MGVSVQALYHYVDSRDALLTALVTDAHNGLADAVDESARACAGRPPAERAVTVGLAYRRWALEHRSAFLLIFGTPVPGYRAPEDGPTSAAARRLGLVFRDVVFDGWTRDDIAAAALDPPATALDAQLGGLPQVEALGLPPSAFALLVTGWGQLHGLVMLEVLGHLPPMGDGAPDLYAFALGELVQRVRRDVDRARAGR
jgi:AcrR family transcriptional regulator